MFEYLTAGRSPTKLSFARCGLAAAAAAASLAFATPSAATVHVMTATPADMWQFGTSVPETLGHEYETMSPFIIQATDNGEPFSALAFCVDFYTSMSGTWNDDYSLYTVEHTYQEGTLQVSEADMSKIVDLVSYGTSLWKFHDHTAAIQTRVAAIQGAIWQITTGKPFEFLPYGNSDPSNNYLIQKYAALDGVRHVSDRDIKIIMSTEQGAQALAYQLRTAVPEPMAWALMIAGFFGAGSALRLARRRALAAV